MSESAVESTARAASAITWQISDRQTGRLPTTTRGKLSYSLMPETDFRSGFVVARQVEQPRQTIPTRGSHPRGFVFYPNRSTTFARGPPRERPHPKLA
ncbi:hypothetical protein BFJ67_g5629 [Fusarium oxysporum f. sp. cepae]|nr:hypothetical protein BFJ67_g5629 [Fusarium oxysporum f. sp. cepae]